MDNLSQLQQAKIYCIKHGHAKFFTNCFGYASCGRCGEQIGDSLMGVFDGKGMALVGHGCKECTEAYNKLSGTDKIIFNRLEKGLNQEDSIKEIDFD